MRSKRGLSLGGESDDEQTLPSPGTEMDPWLSRRGVECAWHVSVGSNALQGGRILSLEGTTRLCWRFLSSRNLKRVLTTAQGLTSANQLLDLHQSKSSAAGTAGTASRSGRNGPFCMKTWPDESVVYDFHWFVGLGRRDADWGCEHAGNFWCHLAFGAHDGQCSCQVVDLVTCRRRAADAQFFLQQQAQFERRW